MGTHIHFLALDRALACFTSSPQCCMQCCVEGGLWRRRRMIAAHFALQGAKLSYTDSQHELVQAAGQAVDLPVLREPEDAALLLIPERNAI